MVCAVTGRVDVTWQRAPVPCWNVLIPNQNQHGIVCYISPMPVVTLFFFFLLLLGSKISYKAVINKPSSIQDGNFIPLLGDVIFDMCVRLKRSQVEPKCQHPSGWGAAPRFPNSPCNKPGGSSSSFFPRPGGNSCWGTAGPSPAFQACHSPKGWASAASLHFLHVGLIWRISYSASAHKN